MRPWICFLALCVLAGSLAGFAPAPPGSQVKTGLVVSSRADANGLVTKLRPAVARVAPGDPFIVVLHWADKSGPITARGPQWRYDREGTVRSLIFTITTPGEKAKEYKLESGGTTATWWQFYYGPTVLLTLTKAGLQLPGNKLAPWANKATLDLAKEGVYTVRISGKILREKEKAIEFKSEPVSLEVSKKVVPQAKLMAAAEAAIKKDLGAVAKKDQMILLDDAKGNIVARFIAPGQKWNMDHYVVTLTPAGKAGKAERKEVFNCVAAGTLVSTLKGPKAIETIRRGDRVWGYDLAKKQRVTVTVREVRPGEAEETLVFGGTLRVTAEHPVWIGEWRRAEDVQSTDHFLTEQGKTATAGTPTCKKGRVAVYDLTVDGPHCFFAGGYLVHNKDRMYSPKLDDLWYKYEMEPAPPKK